MEIDLDLGGMSGDDAEAGGFLDVPGWYKAVVENVGEKEDKTSVIFKFKVVEGPYRNSVVTEYLNLPEWAPSESARETGTKRLGGWFRRLGIWDGTPMKGKARYNLDAAIGQEVMIHLKRRTYTDKKTGKEKETVNIDFMGVYPLDHEKIPQDVRDKFHLPAARKDECDNDQPTLPGVEATPRRRTAERSPRVASPAEDYSDL
jgi:hypothetical protein